MVLYIIFNLLESETAPQPFFVILTFFKNKSPDLGLSELFPQIQIIPFCQKYYMNGVSSLSTSHQETHMMSLFPITDDFNFDDLVKRIPERCVFFFYCMGAIFFFVIDKASVARGILRPVQPFRHPTCPRWFYFFILNPFLASVWQGHSHMVLDCVCSNIIFSFPILLTVLFLFQLMSHWSLCLLLPLFLLFFLSSKCQSCTESGPGPSNYILSFGDIYSHCSKCYQETCFYSCISPLNST